jgi:Calx-beta domain
MRMWPHLGVCLLLGSCAFSADVDGQPTLAFATPTSGADEASSVLMIPVTLSRAGDLEITVEYAVLAGGNATAGSDFSVTSSRLVFAPGEVEKLIPVTINPDSDEMEMAEMAETFQLALSSPTNAQLDEDRAIHSVRIADHILPRVTIGPGFTQSSESSPSQLIVKLDRPAEGPSTVTIGVAPGGPFAATSADYTIADNTVVSFAKGETMKLVDIGEKNDALDEEDEEVIAFSLRGATDNLVVGMSRTMDHKIMDDDASPSITFTTTATIGEGVLPYLLSVSLDNPSGREVRVDYIRDGNDTADADDATVVGSPSTITFDAGQQNKTILITIANDNVDEDNETVLVNFSNAVNALIPTLTHTLTITDNDTASVSFQSASSTVDEDSPGGVSITVRLATPSSKTVTVPFSINAGMSSAEPEDFTVMTASPLTFAPGVTSLTIDIDVPETAPGNENDDRVVIDLGTPTNAPLQSPTRHTLTITE